MTTLIEVRESTAVGRHEPTVDSGYGWVIVATLGVTEAVSYGVLSYAFGVLLVPMQRDLGWSRVELSGAYSLALLASGLAIIPVGRLLDRTSPRLLMTAGSVLAAVLVLAWSRVSTLPQLYLVFLGLGLAMAMVLYESAFVVVTKWFSARRGSALTALTLIAACSSFVFSPLTQRLVDGLGWRGAVAVLALILAAITVPLHGLVLRPAPRPESSIRAAPAGRRTGCSAARHKSFWLIAGAFALSSFTTTAVAVHLVPILIGAGNGATMAAFAAGLMGLSQIPGRVLFAVAGRLDPVARIMVIFGLAALALSLLAVGGSGWVVFVFVVCFGMSNGMLTLTRATLIADLYGRADYGAVSGLANALSLGACAAAPLGAAILALAPGGYTTMLVVLVALTSLAACASVQGIRLGLLASPPA
jgi:MFS family permease